MLLELKQGRTTEAIWKQIVLAVFVHFQSSLRFMSTEEQPVANYKYDIRNFLSQFKIY